MPPRKGPFRTKNTTTIVKIVNYYAVLFLLRPPYLLRCGPFFERKNVCNSQENGVRTRRAAIANYSAIVNSVRIVNLLRVVFLVRRGPLGSAAGNSTTGSERPSPEPLLKKEASPAVLEGRQPCSRGEFQETL